MKINLRYDHLTGDVVCTMCGVKAGFGICYNCGTDLEEDVEICRYCRMHPCQCDAIHERGVDRDMFSDN